MKDAFNQFQVCRCQGPPWRKGIGWLDFPVTPIPWTKSRGKFTSEYSGDCVRDVMRGDV